MKAPQRLTIGIFGGLLIVLLVLSQLRRKGIPTVIERTKEPQGEVAPTSKIEADIKPKQLPRPRPTDELANVKNFLNGKDTHSPSWKTAIENITENDDAARADRVRRRVSLAKIQRFLENSNLPYERRKQLEQLLNSKELLDFDLETVAGQQGVSTKGPEYAQLRQTEKEKIDNGIKALVGDDYFNEIEQGWNRTSIRLYGIEFAGEAYAQGIPLSQVQHEMLSDALAQIDRGDWKSQMNAPADPATGLTAYDLRVFDQLAGALTPEQIDLLKNIRMEANLYRAARELKRLRKEQSEAQVRAPVTQK